MNTPRSRQLGIQGLGWVVRRFVEPATTVESFYARALRLQGLRPRPPETRSLMLWAGDLTMIELNVLRRGAGTDARLQDVSVVMRTTDCGAALRHLDESGASPMSRDHGPTRTATFLDPYGRLVGIQSADGRDAQCAGTTNVTAANGLEAAQVQGAAPRPEDFPDVYGIDLAVADPVAMAAFYSELFGFEPVGGISGAGGQLAFGRRAVLRLLPGGRRHAAPLDRDQVPDAWVLRVFDHAALSARLEAFKVPVVTVRRFTGGIITYGLDPEGHLFGFQQRTPDLLKPGEAERVEDALANRLWSRGQ